MAEQNEFRLIGKNFTPPDIRAVSRGDCPCSRRNASASRPVDDPQRDDHPWDGSVIRVGHAGTDADRAGPDRRNRAGHAECGCAAANGKTRPAAGGTPANRRRPCQKEWICGCRGKPGSRPTADLPARRSDRETEKEGRQKTAASVRAIPEYAYRRCHDPRDALGASGSGLFFSRLLCLGLPQDATS